MQSNSDFENKKQKTDSQANREPVDPDSQLSRNELLDLLNEQNVYQSELEFRNKELEFEKAELKKAIERIEDSEHKYAELYDFSPSGYFTLTREGEIVLLNLTGAKMLGSERSFVKNKLFGLYVSANTRHIFNHFLKNIFTGKTVQTCEIILMTSGDTQLNVLLTGRMVAGTEQCIVTTLDITEKNQMEESLRQSEERFHAISHSANDAIISINSLGLIEEWNQGAERIFGYSESEIIGKDLAMIVPAKYSNMHSESIRSKIASGDYQIVGNTVELLGLHKTGYEFPIELSLAKWETAKGIFFTAIIRDITTRKKAEEELREKEFQYRMLADSGMALIWIAGTDKLCHFFNKIWLEFTGRTIDQEIGNGWAEGVHPDDLERCLDIYVTSFDQHEPFEMEYRLMHSSGEYRWLLDIGTPNFDSAGEFIGFIGHCFDISSRKKVELELVSAKFELEQFFNLVPELIVIASPDGYFKQLNSEWERILGYTKDELLNIPYWSLLHPDDLLSTQIEVERQMMGNTTMKYENRYRKKDGTYRWFEWNATKMGMIRCMLPHTISLIEKWPRKPWWKVIFRSKNLLNG